MKSKANCVKVNDPWFPYDSEEERAECVRWMEETLAGRHDVADTPVIVKVEVVTDETV